jgi:hypothetical protein
MLSSHPSFRARTQSRLDHPVFGPLTVALAFQTQFGQTADMNAYDQSICCGRLSVSAGPAFVLRLIGRSLSFPHPLA